VGADSVTSSSTPSDVPDILGPDLAVVFCGINPGRVSAAARANFANPRNDFWRLLHAAAFTPRLLDPSEQFELLKHGCGMTNAAYRTTPGSGDLRRRDFNGSAERLETLARDLRPRAIAFVGKEAYRGVFSQRPELGAQLRTLGDVGLFVLPSTSPANAAVPYAQRLEWFKALRAWLVPIERRAVRALVLDRDNRTLLVEFRDQAGQVWWATPGGGVDEGEDTEQTLRRELAEEAGLVNFELGPEIWHREHTFAWAGRILHQQDRIHLVRIVAHEPAPRVDLAAEGVANLRWWTLDELERTSSVLVPARLAEVMRDVLRDGPPREPLDVGV
jgi:TDG/mug DNA glycosylase family protein